MRMISATTSLAGGEVARVVIEFLGQVLVVQPRMRTMAHRRSTKNAPPVTIAL
jgi:hypothetical protein